MNRSNMKAYVAAIHSAALSRKAALQCELAVGFAVMLEAGPNKRLVRAQMCEIYASAGYKCREPSDIDWQSINRRIGASMLLYEFITEAEVKTWAGDLTRSALVDAIVKKLEPLKLGTCNEVIQICKSAKVDRPTYSRRPGVKIDTAHLHINVPVAATAEELLEAAGKLMQMAQAMVEARQAVEQEHEVLEAA